MAKQTLKITQVTKITNSTIQVTFHKQSITRLINQNVIRVKGTQAYFNSHPIHVQDYIIIGRNSITIISPQSFDFLFKDVATEASDNHENSAISELQDTINELKASNNRQVTTIEQLQRLLNEYKSKNDDLRKRLVDSNAIQEQLVLEREKLKGTITNLQKMLNHYQKNQHSVEQKVQTSKQKPKEMKKNVKKPVSKTAPNNRSVTKSVSKAIKTAHSSKASAKKRNTNQAVKNSPKREQLYAKDEKRFEQLRKMSKSELNKALNIDGLPIRERFEKSRDLRILAMKANSKAELARWLYRGDSTIQDWVRATDNREVIDHFNATKAQLKKKK